MLTRKLQIQALADRLAGLPTNVSARHLRDPWRTCWLALDGVGATEYHTAMTQALEGNSERGEILEAIFAARPGYQMAFESLEDLAPNLSPIEWVWPGWLPRGMLTVLGAAPGAGKSFVGLDLAWRITTGEGFPDGSPIPNSDANVLYIDGEAVPQILNERAEHYQIDRKRMYLLLPDSGEPIDFGTDKYRDRLINMVATLRPELVVVDSLSSIHSRGQNNVEDVRNLLSFFSQLAEAYRIGLVLIHHIRKPGNGHNMQMFDLSMDDLSGSAHIVAMARVVWGIHVVQTGPEPDPNGPRKLKMLKTNLGPYEESLGFEFAPLHPKGVYLKWSQDAPQAYREPTKEDGCAAWLLEMLQDGAMKPKEVIAAGKNEGFSRSVIYRARRSLSGQVDNTDGKKSPMNKWELVKE
ncbi:MAG: AAA family ATPase [Chloroflexota bacterium]|nr:AAA family ATPase [Chloroflexota bacterium]